MDRSFAGKDACLADFLASFFRAFETMPHRGSGSHFEARAARMLTEASRDLLDARVEQQSFAVDLSSGVWSVAVHGWALLGLLALSWGGGLVLASAWGAGASAVDLGFLGRAPLASAIAATVSCLAVFLSRVAMDRGGRSLASFFVPNVDSANVLVHRLEDPPADWVEPGAPPAAGSTMQAARLAPAERWRRRFAWAKAERGLERVLVLSAHYDSARALPPLAIRGGPAARLLRWALRQALKNGLGLMPTLGCLALGLLFALGAAFPSATGHWGLFGMPWGWVPATFLLLIGLVFTLTELVTATISSNKPSVPGFNDNLSGVASVMGCLRAILPPPGADGTAVIAVLTGSEENGLHGARTFARETLAPAIAVFGIGRVLLVNADTVSGGQIQVAATEGSFAGQRRGGDPAFAAAALEKLGKVELDPGRVAAAFGSWPPGESLEPRGSGYRYRIAPAEGAFLPAVTDLTGFCSLPGVNRALRAFTVVGRMEADDAPLDQPRDYHQMSDGPELLFSAEEPDNFATVVALTLALEDLAAAAASGDLDGRTDP